MKPYLLLFYSFLLINCSTMAQDKMNKEEAQKSTEIGQPQGVGVGQPQGVAPTVYHQIPDYPDKLSVGNTIGRTIDGLGYRYYWATKNLTEKDLAYSPGNEGRSTEGTLGHLFGLSLMILKAAKNEPNIRPSTNVEMTWNEKRKQTLQNFKTASDIFKASSDETVNDFKIIFKRGEKTNEFPIWNLLNGPIADAIYHVGQVVSYRRSSGNPMNPFVSVFMGKTKE